jgi:lipopolysaccharide export system protein LptC
MTAASPSAGPALGDDLWEPRRQLSLEAARRRSARLSGLRFVFVALAAGAFASIFVFMAVNAVSGGQAGQAEAAGAAQRMENPRFVGRSKTGKRYIITAKTAVRQPGSEAILLETPIYEEDTGRKMLSIRGLYDPAARTIQLDGDVNFEGADGQGFASTNAFIDAEAGVIRGERAIRGAGPLGSVRSDTYEIAEDGRRIILRGRVQGTIQARGGSNP